MPQLGVVRVQVAFVVQDRTFGSGPHPGQRPEQRGLPRSAGADNRHQVALADRKAHMVEQYLAARDPHGQILRDERDVALVDELPQFVTDEAERRTSDAEDVCFRHGRRGYRFSVDERPVVAAQVHDLVPAATRVPQLGMVPGDAEVRHDEVVVGPAPDAQHLDRRAHHRCGPAVDAHARITNNSAAGPRAAGPGDRAEHDRPVSRIAEPQDAILVDLDPPDPAGSHEGPVGAAGVLENPRTPVQLEDRVMPRHP